MLDINCDYNKYSRVDLGIYFLGSNQVLQPEKKTGGGGLVSPFSENCCKIELETIHFGAHLKHFEI